MYLLICSTRTCVCLCVFLMVGRIFSHMFSHLLTDRLPRMIPTKCRVNLDAVKKSSWFRVHVVAFEAHLTPCSFMVAVAFPFLCTCALAVFAILVCEGFPPMFCEDRVTTVSQCLKVGWHALRQDAFASPFAKLSPLHASLSRGPFYHQSLSRSFRRISPHLGLFKVNATLDVTILNKS